MWQKAVKDADRDYRRRHGIGFIYTLRRIFGKAFHVAVTLIIVAVALTGSYFAYTIWSHNSRLITGSREQIVERINLQLVSMRLEPIESIALPSASYVFGVPELLGFQETIYREGSLGRRPFGTVKGQFDRTSGLLEMDIDLIEGQDLAGLRFQLEPVTEPSSPDGATSP